MNVAIVVEPPKGKRWRKVLQRFGGDPRLGIVVSSDEGATRAASFVIERMGGSTLLLVRGDRLSLLALDIHSQRLFDSDILVRCVKFMCLPVSRRLVNLGLALLLFPRADAAERFLGVNRLALARCGSARFVARVRPCRRVDLDTLAKLARHFSRSWGARALQKAGVEASEYVSLWSSIGEQA